MAANARRYRLAVFTKNRKNPAYVGARLGADRVAARHGCVVTHFVPDKPDDVDEQHALLEAAYAERPDALLIAPAHATALNGTLRRMQADGIPILCFVSRPEEIGVGRPGAGAWDRRLSVDRLDGAGDVVTLEGHPIAITTAARAAGFRDAARARGNIRIVDSPPGYFLRDRGHAGMIELLAAQPRIDGVLAANDFMALGALDAMRETGRKMPIVGVNATPEGVQAIKAGDMLASASFDAMKMACLGVEAAVRVLCGEQVPAEILLPVEVVDRANCAAWDLPYAQRPLPEWSAYLRG
jgi:ribose transport system substrate-binding protein